MTDYTVTVKRRVPAHLLHDLDKNVAGQHQVKAADAERALDLFHGIVPIKVLEHFEITCRPSNETECPKCGHTFPVHNDDGSCVSDEPMYRCDNCGLEAPHDELPRAKDMHERLLPGEIYTDVECADDTCGALCFPVDGPHTPAQSLIDHDSLPVLGKFGDAVLDILQDDEDWNSDTFQKLNDAAFNLHLLVDRDEFQRKSINDIREMAGEVT